MTTRQQPIFQNITVNTVDVHPDLQRPTSEVHVVRIVKRWNPDAFGVPIVAHQRHNKDRFWVVAGAHRFEAARRMGMTHVFCQVVADNSDEAMAQAYLDEQTQREQNPLVRHRIALAAGDPLAVGVQGVCDEMGYRIPTAKGGLTSNEPGTIRALKPLYQLYEDGLLRDALTIVTEAFDKSGAACQGWFLTALVGFLKYAGTIKTYRRSDLVRSLKRVGIDGLQLNYTARKRFETEVVMVVGTNTIIDAYNRGRRTGRIEHVSRISGSFFTTKAA